MIRNNKPLKTALSAACALLLAGPAFSAGMTQEQQQGAMQPMSNRIEYETVQLIGHDVVNRQGEKLGKIRNLAIGDNGQITYAVLGVGGLAGMREKELAIPFEQLQISDNLERITLDVSKERVTSEFSAFEEVRKGEAKMKKQKTMPMERERQREREMER